MRVMALFMIGFTAGMILAVLLDSLAYWVATEYPRLTLTN